MRPAIFASRTIPPSTSPLNAVKGDPPVFCRQIGRMVTRTLSSLMGLALNFEGADAPAWVQLLPAGPMISGRDGRRWTLQDPQAVVSRFDPAKLPQIDLEHSSHLKAPKGEPAPAVGWIEALELRDGAIWGRVEWTAEGANAVTSRAYRYLSPVFAHNAAGQILRLASAGLTNSPNLEMAALNSAHNQETDMTIAAVLQALKLAPTATEADAVVAINQMQEREMLALNAAKQPDPDKFVPVADHQLALNQITQYQTAEKARAEEGITAAVDAAITAGKVAPSSRDYHLAACRAEGGLERFNTAMNSAPVIAPPSKLDGQPPTSKSTLSAEELAACHALGLSAEEFLSAKPE